MSSRFGLVLSSLVLGHLNWTIETLQNKFGTLHYNEFVDWEGVGFISQMQI